VTSEKDVVGRSEVVSGWNRSSPLVLRDEVDECAGQRQASLGSSRVIRTASVIQAGSGGRRSRLRRLRPSVDDWLRPCSQCSTGELFSVKEEVRAGVAHYQRYIAPTQAVLEQRALEAVAHRATNAEAMNPDPLPGYV
jgi:hypothetical protein